MLWLYLHLPSLQLDNSGQQHSEQAVAVVCPKQHQLLQLNKAGRQAGLHPHMGLATAATLCHSLTTIIYSERQSRQALTQLANRLYRVTADISLWPPDGLLLRVTPMLRLYGDLDTYWRQVQTILPDGFNYDYACAEAPLAARLLARSQAQLVTSCPASMRQALNHAPIDGLDGGNDTHTQLKKVGVRTVGELLAIPPGQLNRRFNKDFVHYLHQLSGQLPHPVRWYHPPSYFKAQMELLYECDNTHRLTGPICKLLKELADYWITRDKVSLHIRYVLLLRDAADYCFDIHAAVPSRCPDFWLRLTQLKLESIDLPAPVYAIRLICHRLQPYQANNGSLLGYGPSGNTAILLSTLESKLGSDGVLTPQLKDDHRPEVRNSYQSASQYPEQTSLSRRLSPSLLLPEPIPLDEKVRIVHGPERLTTGWWDHHPAHRDYFIATSEDGRWLWVYRTPDQGWYIHGIFS